MTRPPAGHRLARPRRTVPTQLAALAAGVPEATIRKWASRGKLSRYGTPGRAEYDLDELIELVPDASSGPDPAAPEASRQVPGRPLSGVRSRQRAAQRRLHGTGQCDANNVSRAAAAGQIVHRGG